MYIIDVSDSESMTGREHLCLACGTNVARLHDLLGLFPLLSLQLVEVQLLKGRLVKPLSHSRTVVTQP